MTTLTPEEEAASTRAAEQARLRKARREAKIKAGAESRLKTITGLGGGVQRDPAPAAASAPAAPTDAPSNAAPAAPATSPRQHADPDEVDISQHFYQPQTTARVPPPPASDTTAGPNISDSQLRQMMLGLDQPPSAPGMPNMPPGMEDDPMLRMMMQMLGGGPGGAGNANPFINMSANMNMPFPPPPGGAQNPQQQQQQEDPQLLPNRSSSLWRLLHTAIALSLGLYIALFTPFAGTKLERDRAAAAAAGSAEEREALAARQDTTSNFFWAFATAEAVLLTTRWFVDRGRSRLGGSAGPGLLGMLVGFLPPAVQSKVEMAMRYGEVFGTVKGDVLVCVFVLGAAAWWRG
ncbi:hypothetical protein MFIFM68171_03489 [Madurella fahalii]|uniref:Golgi to ER traffic protein 2 n=1 Tax=Madurella fahalii TaxID=1157608 RepID=A0ABQ0G686_9PEZI